MPYFVYRLYEQPLRRVEPLEHFERYAEASRYAKEKRAQPEAKGCAIRVVFAPNALAAEEALMNPREAPPRVGDDY